ncbi:hypothetical protein BLNAU_17942 [Blattamonas nauphoetae]|uniref:RING-type domain-containing protein n=1 Tax=Blattamonas nauphoetae TaxID=2049346 RepID=A0ABQ9X5V8_9EUKA|nr:hypothetical protein BLNAU_17942 [Blattamonas nauphoetae]
MEPSKRGNRFQALQNRRDKDKLDNSQDESRCPDCHQILESMSTLQCTRIPPDETTSQDQVHHTKCIVCLFTGCIRQHSAPYLTLKCQVKNCPNYYEFSKTNPSVIYEKIDNIHRSVGFTLGFHICRHCNACHGQGSQDSFNQRYQHFFELCDSPKKFMSEQFHNLCSFFESVNHQYHFKRQYAYYPNFHRLNDHIWTCSKCAKQNCMHCTEILDAEHARTCFPSTDGSFEEFERYISAVDTSCSFIVCPFCRTQLEKGQGCNHIQCILCQADLCAQCGLPCGPLTSHTHLAGRAGLPCHNNCADDDLIRNRKQCYLMRASGNWRRWFPDMTDYSDEEMEEAVQIQLRLQLRQQVSE